MSLKPINLKCTKTSTWIVATWEPSSVVNLGGWLVHWRVKGTVPWSTTIVGAAVESYRIAGLVPSTEYEVQVRALAAEGAATVTVKTEASTPPPEAGVPVRSSPLGVSGLWHPELADGFGAPLGTGVGQDNFWYPNRGGSNPAELRPGDNPDELQVYSDSQVSVDGEGLRLRCLQQTNVGGTGKNFVSGTIRSVNASAPAGYRLFKWKPTAGQAFALEIVWKLPANTGEMDPAFWSTDSAWTAESDHPEMWGFGHLAYYMGCPVWIYRTPTSSVRHESYDLAKDLGVDPVATFVTFTTVMNADGSHSFYCNGSHKWDVAPPPSEPNRPWMGVIVQNALRSNTSGFKSGFTSGFRDLQARSVAVYTDAAHAGQNVQNGGVAVGSRLV